MDVHVPRCITDALRARGVSVLTAQDDGLREADDATLLARAVALQRVLFTRDEDFLVLCAQWQQEGRPFPGVIYAHQLRATIGRCVHDLELMAQAAAPEELANRVEHLPLS